MEITQQEILGGSMERARQEEHEMGIFTKMATCPICGVYQEIGRVNMQLNDGSSVCRSCLNRVRSEDYTKIPQWTAEEYRQVADRADWDKQIFGNFRPTKKLAFGKLWSCNAFAYDDNLEVWTVELNKIRSDNSPPKFFKFTEIENFEYLEDNQIVYTNWSTLGELVGVALMGPVGVIGGAAFGKKTTAKEVRSMKIVVKLKNSIQRQVIIDIHNNPEIRSDQSAYKKRAEESELILQAFNHMVRKVQGRLEKITSSQQQSYPSLVDEIFKLKSLLDAGALTSEEFEHMKKRIISSS